ncbi:MAG: hypothetical protein NZ610_06915 [Candidatus Bipolaricaulota bacterium]|nr:hypothetical protein [Candidatus Bipolaricaulota bacterium]MCS7275110.1 hypothetical protein [Candidatus Bipolaricaulota bacterium]MDW8110278.1 hypothetical protein [Candidatus Bipolaricaulota bacterium]MDW8328821.1 hypothetical protein [Candidatus Bipolaricaulota bacterium]
MAETNRRIQNAPRAARKTYTTEKGLVTYTPEAKAIAEVVETLWDEIAEYSQRYLAALDAIRQIQDPDSDEFAERWAEIDVSLFVMQLKIKDVLKEMERLEESWPD